MNIYLSCFVAGVVGLLVLGLSGLAGHHGGMHHGSSAKFHPAGKTGSHAQGGAGHHQSPKTSLRWLAWLSPLFLCSMLMGFGLVGLAVGPIAGGWIQLTLALLGAYLVRRYTVQPLLGAILQWASLPARTLDTLVLETGVATTNFDASGYGMVRVDLNGEVLQLLGQIPPEERSGTRVSRGETVVVRSIDPARQRCTVCRPESARSA